MSNIKDIVNTLVKEFATNDKLNMDFEHHVQMSKMHPGGIDKYFLELRFEHYKKIDQNLIGHNWIQRNFIYPFSRMENTDETWIEFVVNTWQKKYATKNDSDLIEGLDFAAELEMTVFLREYFHIQQIDSYLASLSKTEDSDEFCDFFVPEFKNKELFIERLKEVMKGKKGNSIRFMIESLIHKGILMEPEKKRHLYDPIRRAFGWKIGSENAVIYTFNEYETSKKFQEYIRSKNCAYIGQYSIIDQLVDKIVKEHLTE